MNNQDRVEELINCEYQELMRRYTRYIATIFRRRKCDQQTTEELISETLLRIWTSRDSYRGQGSVKCWVRKIAVNIFRDWCRKLRTQRKHICFIDIEKLAAVPGSRLSAIQHQLNRRRLAVVLHGFKRPERQLYVLAFKRRLSLNEVAQRLAMSVDAAKQARYRLKEKIIRLLDL